MNKSIKLILIVLAFFMIMGCSGNQDVLVGDTVDIEHYNRPSDIIKYQWSFDTKPPTSRLDPRDFIPSNYHPNVTFIPDVPGRYIVRLTMINREGSVLHKNFIFTADRQPDYLVDLEKENAKKELPVKETKTIQKPPKIIEIPVVTEKVILKKTTVTKTPNEWKKAPKPGENLEEIEQEPAYSTESVTEVIEEKKEPVTMESKTIISSPNVSVTNVNSNAKYTLQVSSSTVEAYAIELKNKLLTQGYDSFIQKAKVDGIMRYRIRIGHFTTYGEAKAYRSKILNETDFEPWVDKIK
ncbi:MAG: SPOR domain-containing protein [Candidatus Marinimicrobia bacterium]|nr:SPOR domain-containing protein [Candidatus Neomarinimicrobiota bacterium]